MVGLILKRSGILCDILNNKLHCYVCIIIKCVYEEDALYITCAPDNTFS